jgi:hypothetical protein
MVWWKGSTVAKHHQPGNLSCRTYEQVVYYGDVIRPGRSLPLIFCIHVRLGPIY